MLYTMAIRYCYFGLPMLVNKKNILITIARNDFHLNGGKLSVGSISDTGDRTQLLYVGKLRKNMKILKCKIFAAKHITTRTSWNMGMLHCMSCPETGGLKPIYLTYGYTCK